ncbi:MAG: glycosyltransferase [Methanococcaceae archaeon]
MSFTILNVAYPFALVSKNSTGGAEQILSILDRELVSEGHNSIVLACEGSSVKGKLYTIPDSRGIIDNAVRNYIHTRCLEKLAWILRKETIDLIHFHGLDFSAYMPQTEVPALITLHLPTDWYSKASFNFKGREVYYNCVSCQQHMTAPVIRNLFPYITNGIYVREFPVKRNKRGYALSLGRICPEKGYHEAAEAARIAQVPFVLAGELYPYEHHVNYFEHKIKPYLDGQSFKYLGAAPFKLKKELLSDAACLLVPSLVEETSSLATMEALACGTPVIAYARGALKELIADGVTGFLVNNLFEMAEAIKQIGSIDSDECRRSAEENLEAEKMALRYFSLYETIISTAKSKSNPHILKLKLKNVRK